MRARGADEHRVGEVLEDLVAHPGGVLGLLRVVGGVVRRAALDGPRNAAGELRARQEVDEVAGAVELHGGRRLRQGGVGRAAAAAGAKRGAGAPHDRHHARRRDDGRLLVAAARGGARGGRVVVLDGREAQRRAPHDLPQRVGRLVRDDVARLGLEAPRGLARGRRQQAPVERAQQRRAPERVPRGGRVGQRVARVEARQGLDELGLLGGLWQRDLVL